jgi:hypothetical protein
MPAEGGVAPLAVEDLVRAGGDDEIRNRIHRLGLDDGSVMDVT